MTRSFGFASLAGLVGVGLVALHAGCGSSSGSGFDDGEGADGGLAGEGGLGVGADGGLGGNGEGGAASCGTCSADLHTAYDCNGTATKCPDDQGCASGTCIAACDAASASHTSIGCDYFTMNPDVLDNDNIRGSCFAVFVANTWGSPVTLTAEYGGATIDVSNAAKLPSGTGSALTYAPLPSGQLPAGEVAIVFLAASATAAVRCPAGVTPAVVADAAIHSTGIGKAFHLKASAPIVAYQEFPYGGGNSAVTGSTLLLPSSVWTTNYVAASAYTADPFASWITIVAAEDNTKVDLTPPVAIVGAGAVPSIAAGTTGTIMLQRGQLAELSTTSGDLSGTPILASAPVGVFGGNACMNVPSGQGACDGAHQQIPPVAALGHTYVGVGYRPRFAAKADPPAWRIVGAVDGTTLTWSPSAPPGAPATVGKGQVVEFSAAGPFVVSSQGADHPFYLAEYMTGWTNVSSQAAADSRGDPEVTTVVSPEQYLSSYVFFTDPTYPETNLVIVRKKGTSGFSDVTLDCAGALTGWAPAGTSGDYEWTRFDLSTGNFTPNGSCNNGRHTMTSDATFGLTVWGWGSAATGGTFGATGGSGFYTQAVSYAYPAGMSVTPINTVVVPPAPR